MRSLLLSLTVGLAAAVLADEVPWKWDASKRTEPVPSSAVSSAVTSLAARNVVAAESAASSGLDAWSYSSALLRGQNVDASPRGAVILIR